MSPESRNLLQRHLFSSRNACSVGGFGALAEFDEGDAVSRDEGDERLTLRNERGAISINWNFEAEACAFESVSARENAWLCGVGYLYPAVRCTPPSVVVTELGRDKAALDPTRRENYLFDLGAGLTNVRFCIRTADARLIDNLRRLAGQPVLNGGHSIIDEIIDVSPHRIVFNELVRIEVYQNIDRHETPAGSHTHVLPNLLKAKRTHSANLPYPDGTVPLLTLHPENPLSDEFGRARSFDREAFTRFESCLNRFGWMPYVTAKNALIEAFEQNDLTHYRPARTRVGRSAEKIALRQLHHLGAKRSQLKQWSEQLRH